ncbi:ATP-binding cassette domain-containing protein [Clostridiaceae bacterium DONG20-135]|uniref:ATP-binding cassette domain-containing protein n=1 Tax=Copranaerobaculum intestinale TaxID=2692629 RepID=A0A6N8U606_9FIRM|nr:ABC transporter ATP-binding protein [Copranaerobaculum intestinale]MXQ73636.1 ATP-binding cassette domain-containing protein [Copranaerobaculum intestinale]
MLKRMFPYMKKYQKYLLFSCICVVAETIFELIIPLIMADIIDVGVANRDQHYILIKGLQMIVCAILSLILGMMYARYAATAGQGFGAELRKDEFRKVQNFSFANTDHFSTSSLITRLTSDVTILQTAISNGIRPLVRSPVMLVTALILSFTINAELAVVFLIAIPVLGAALFIIVRRVGPLYRSMQKAIDYVNSIIQETLNAIRVVKSYVRGEYEKEKFEGVNDQLKQTSERAFRTSALNMPLFQLVMYTTIICIIWFGGNLIFVGTMKVGELTGFLSYVMQILNSLMMISNVFLMLTRSLASCSRIIEVLDEVPDIDDSKSQALEVTQGTIDFKHVFFKYKANAEEEVLTDINLHIPGGSTLGILGGTGAAKTTLVQLIPRLYDVSAGEVLIDGHNVKQYPIKHLRDAIGMVLQKNILFSGTIKENLLWGDEHASDEDIKWACNIAAVDEFIGSFPEGYDTDLGQGGVNVSGGQKQRLCIARALLKRPKVLIFDDSTSAVDTATEASIREGLAGLNDTTKIIIAQRVTSLMHADQIVILDDGNIHAIGTHESLLRDDPIYQDIYYSQQEGAGL